MLTDKPDAMDEAFAMTLAEEADFWLTPSRLPASAKISVSVVIPTFGAEATLMRAIRSALGQTLRDIELIIVDDASTDASWQLITDMVMADPRIRAIRHKQNRGKPVAMNNAIAIAGGRWLAVLDADDWYHRDRLATLIEIGEKWRADLVADNQFFYDGPADLVVGTAWPSGTASWELSFDDFLVGSNAYETFNLGMLKPVLRLDFMRKAGLAYEETARHGQDFFHMLQFYLAGGRAVIDDTPYYYYTQPFGVISHRWSHLARKRYNFQNAYEINQRYICEKSNNIPPHKLNKLKLRNKKIKNLEYYYCAKDAMLQKNVLKSVFILLKHPSIIEYLFLRFRSRFRNKPRYFVIIHRIAVKSFRRDSNGGLNAGQCDP